MKSPICSFDAKTGVLCSKCEAELQSGDITGDDVNASITLSRLAQRNQDVNKFTLVRGIQVGDDFVLVLGSADVSLLRQNAALADRVEKEFGHKTWFVEAEASDRRFMENLFHPARVLSINLFWLPDGNKLTKVTAAEGAQKSMVDVEKIQKIAREVRSIELLVEFATQR